MRHLWALILSLSAVVVAVSCGGGGGTNNSTGGHTGGSHGNGGSNTGGHPSTGSGTGNDGGGFIFDAGGDSCSAITCADLGATCGMIDDGCGKPLDCGATCPDGQTCGGAGTPNVCGTPPCTPKTCADQGIECGPAGDGCGNALDCGTCTAPDTCGGGGTPSVCGHASMCTPKTCAQQAINCGPAGDGCGNQLDCGTCPPNQTCGGGGMPGVCGAPACTPKTCAQLNVNCGPMADGCGGLLDCGTCANPQTCGGAGMPNVCGIPSTCTNLCLKQVTCSNPNVTTTISGTVYAPNGTDPLPNALVYVPNATVQPFTPGVSCDNCGAAASGSPLVSAVTAIDGKFSIKNAPVGTNIPLVIQIGRWRRQITISNVSQCVDNPQPASKTRLPKNKSEGDIPLMAFATGSVDSLECVMRKIGIDDAEFTNQNGNGRIHLWVGSGSGGATISGSGTENTLVGSQTNLNKYDIILFPCQGDQFDKNAATLQRLVNYANAGGRIFATHYSYVWFYNNAPFSSTANWAADQGLISADPQIGYIDTSFPKGLALAQWMMNVGASTTLGQIQNQHPPQRLHQRGGAVAAVGDDRRSVLRRDAHALHVQHAGGRAGGAAVRARGLRRLPRRGLVQLGADVPERVHQRADDGPGEDAGVHALRPGLVRDARHPHVHAQDLRAARRGLRARGRRLRRRAPVRDLPRRSDVQRHAEHVPGPDVHAEDVRAARHPVRAGGRRLRRPPAVRELPRRPDLRRRRHAGRLRQPDVHAEDVRAARHPVRAGG
ncbi:MAG: hypothetical protein QM820_25125 [Minicystis sp.]